jgi:hypothetical protein
MSKKIINLEHSITMVRDRIKDIEWELSYFGLEGLEDDVSHIVERRKAVDKLRHLQKELLQARLGMTNET